MKKAFVFFIFLFFFGLVNGGYLEIFFDLNSSDFNATSFDLNDDIQGLVEGEIFLRAYVSDLSEMSFVDLNSLRLFPYRNHKIPSIIAPLISSSNMVRIKEFKVLNRNDECDFFLLVGDKVNILRETKNVPIPVNEEVYLLVSPRKEMADCFFYFVFDEKEFILRVLFDIILPFDDLMGSVAVEKDDCQLWFSSDYCLKRGRNVEFCADKFVFDSNASIPPQLLLNCDLVAINFVIQDYYENQLVLREKDINSLESRVMEEDLEKELKDVKDRITGFIVGAEKSSESFFDFVFYALAGLCFAVFLAVLFARHRKQPFFISMPKFKIKPKVSEPVKEFKGINKEFKGNDEVKE